MYIHRYAFNYRSHEDRRCAGHESYFKKEFLKNLLCKKLFIL